MDAYKLTIENHTHRGWKCEQTGESGPGGTEMCVTVWAMNPKSHRWEIVGGTRHWPLWNMNGLLGHLKELALSGKAFEDLKLARDDFD